jgi:hypothetical protein
MGGWKPAAIVTAEDVAVTALRVLDMEDALAPADSPIERRAADFETEGAVVPASTGAERTTLKADAKGLSAVLTVDLPDAGLYTVEGFVDAGSGHRWRADGCRKAVLCAGSPSGWRTVMTQAFSAGRHAFSVTLADGASVDRVRFTRRKATAGDYLAALRRLGFDPGTGELTRPMALAAMEFIHKTHADRHDRFCGDVAEPGRPSREASPVTTTTVASTSPGTTTGAVPPSSIPLSQVLLPPQERSSPVLPVSGPS